MSDAVKLKDLVLAGLTYLVGVTVTHFVARGFESDAAGVAQVVGTVLGVSVAVWLYQYRNDELAPAKVKVAVGATLAALCVLQGLAFQLWLEWMTYPAINIFFGALGALGFPFVLWNTIGKAVIESRKR